MSVFVTSDIHFSHRKILEYCPDSRPFSSVEEMNEAIVDNWNKKITNADDVYILGDVSFGKPKETCDFLDRLKGKRLYLVVGNHDSKKFLKEDSFIAAFEWVKLYNEEKLFGRNIVMFHFPIESWNRKHWKSTHIHGHLHSKNPDKLTQRRVDVGLDGSPNFAPYNLEELLIDIENRLIEEETVCHHGRNL